jgi:hypothetical protein
VLEIVKIVACQNPSSITITQTFRTSDEPHRIEHNKVDQERKYSRPSLKEYTNCSEIIFL